MRLDPALAQTEPDPEIQDLIKASAGLNLALDYLPGSVTFDPLAETIEPLLASCIVWLDAFITNVDRTPRNANMLMWHRQLWLIDHGAALYFHHHWPEYLARATSHFALIKDHVLLGQASQLEEANRRMTAALTPAVIDGIVALIPDELLDDDPMFAGPDAKAQQRDAYRQYLLKRIQSPHLFVEEALRARSAHL